MNTPLTEAQRTLVASAYDYVPREIQARLRRRPWLHQHFDDFVQEGYLGLIHAARLFNPTRGFKFKTYAKAWIRCYLNLAVSMAPGIKTPRKRTKTERGWHKPMKSVGASAFEDDYARPEFVHAPTTDDDIDARRVRGLVQEALITRGVCDLDRFVFEQVHFNGATCASLGRLLGVSRQSASYRLSRAEAAVEKWAAEVRKEAA